MNQQSLIDYVLHLADSTLILSHRNSEWCGHGPVLEQDIAITNIALDLLGQSRNFYQYAAELINQSENKSETEDSLAYLRDEREYKNLLLTELPKSDWGHTIMRQYFFSVYQYLLFEQLQEGSDTRLAAIAAKSIKETTYHIKWCSDWVIRLGDGTEESHNRMQDAINNIADYTGELFEPAAYEQQLANAGIKIDNKKMAKNWLTQINQVLEEATLSFPQNTFTQTGGKTGSHTENLGFILAEMQYLQRSHPGATW